MTKLMCLLFLAAGFALTGCGGTSDPVIAPTITAQPADQSALSGDGASFSISASGTSPAYQWQSSSDGSSFAAVAGATSSTYSIAATAPSMNGTLFRVVVSNSAGSVTSAAARLTVTAPAAPSISSQPSEQFVAAGASATFAAGIAGAPTPMLLWQQSTDDGASWTDIAGATAANYTVGTAASADNGKRYRIVATNRLGSATSDAALLSVTPVTAGLDCSGPEGSGWCRVTSPRAEQLNAVAKVTASTLVAVGDAGTILRSTDGGVTWTAVPSGTAESLTGVAFGSATVGIATGSGGTLLRSADGGLSWAPVNGGSSGATFYAVAFASHTTAVVVGDRVIRSEDGGVTWGVVVPPTTGDCTCTNPGNTCPLFLSGVAFADSSIGAAVSFNRRLRTVDGAKTWVQVDPGFCGFPRAVAFSGTALGVAVGGPSCGFDPVRMSTTADGGRTWIDRGFPPGPGFGMVCPPGGLRAVALPTVSYAVAVGPNGRVSSIDGGITWTGITNMPVAAALVGIAFINAKSGVVVGGNGTIIITRTGGF